MNAITAPTPEAPFSRYDWTWLNGNSRQKTSVLDTKYFTGEFRADVTYVGSFDHPSDHTLVGTFELDHREASVPYFAGPGGATPPGGNTGAPSAPIPGFTPDLRKGEARINLALLVKI